MFDRQRQRRTEREVCEMKKMALEIAAARSRLHAARAAHVEAMLIGSRQNELKKLKAEVSKAKREYLAAVIKSGTHSRF